MSNVNALLSARLKAGGASAKMTAMAQQSANGNLTSFSGVFHVSELNQSEKTFLESLLNEYALDKENFAADLNMLISITSEVKAINNQATILHGERIKKVHEVLTRYRDGAFTAWLIATYGNRQTPYNFMQYYLFYQTLPQALHSKVESMPRQAIYTLATREGVLDKKQKIIENYQGETKEQLLNLIRENFPLDSVDRRRQDIGEKVTRHLKKLYEETKNKKFTLSKEKKREIFILLDKLRSVIGCQE